MTLQLQAAIQKALRSDENAYLAGYEGKALRDLEDELQQGLAQIHKIRTHSHSWNDDDYCSICGADGRA